MKVAFVRGAYLNNFEGQNYDLQNKCQIIGYSSLFPIDTHVPFPVTKLPSLADLQTLALLNKPIKYIANRTVGDSQLLWGLEKHILGADIVHVGDPHYYYSYQAAYLKSKGLIKKLISTWWETIPFNNESTGAKKRIKKFTMAQVDMFLCHSEKAKKCLLMEGVSDKQITVIPLGVDLNAFRQKIDSPSKNITILFVGRLVEEKGIMDLYEAFKELVKIKKNIQLKIIGKGPLKDVLSTQIRRDCLLGNVTIEQKTYNEMPKVFHQTDIFCAPSRKTSTWEEQYGMVFIEAMASGLPIVSYNTGAIPELVQDSGLLSDEGNTKQLVQSLLKLCSDTMFRSKIGTMGRERAKRMYDAKKTSDHIYEMYKTLNSKL